MARMALAASARMTWSSSREGDAEGGQGGGGIGAVLGQGADGTLAQDDVRAAEEGHQGPGPRGAGRP